MSLNNTESANGYLEAVGGDGVAVSKQIVQNTGPNIGLGSTTDTLNTTEALIVGDELLIIKDDESKVDFTVTDVTSVPSAKAHDIHADFTEASGTVIRSSDRFGSASYAAWKAFDTVLGDIWVAHSAFNEWIGYQFNAPTPISEIKYKAQTNGPKNAKYEISDDGVTWTTIHTFVGADRIADWQSYVLPTPVTTQYIRLYVTDCYDNITLYVQEIEIVSSAYNTLDTSSVTAGEVPSKAYYKENYERDFAAIRNISMDLEFGTISINQGGGIITEQMTSATTPSGIVTSLHAPSPDYDPFVLFDRQNDYGHVFRHNVKPTWIKYELPTAKIADEYVMVAGFLTGSTDWSLEAPTSWDLHGSNDNSTWDLLDTQSDIVWAGEGERKTFSISSPKSYLYYRITLKTSNYTYVYLAELELIYTGTGTVVDTLETTHTLTDGDSLVIVKDDDSIHQVVASGVTGTGPYTLDTSTITAGEAPSRVYKLNDSVQFNALTPANPVDNFTVVGNLRTTRIFDDVYISGRTIETTVNLSQGNKMTRLSADIDVQI